MSILTTRRALSHAILQGSMLAVACGGQTAGSGGSPQPGATTRPEGSTEPPGPREPTAHLEPTSGSPEVGEGLPPIPAEKLGCSGPDHDGGFAGQCCKTAECYTPDAGKCASAKEAHARVATPPGSGSCGCGGPIEGPYSDGKGACCYIVGAIGCEGRPLMVAGRALVAGPVDRNDWAAPGARTVENRLGQADAG